MGLNRNRLCFASFSAISESSDVPSDLKSLYPRGPFAPGPPSCSRQIQLVRLRRQEPMAQGHCGWALDSCFRRRTDIPTARSRRPGGRSWAPACAGARIPFAPDRLQSSPSSRVCRGAAFLPSGKARKAGLRACLAGFDHSATERAFRRAGHFHPHQSDIGSLRAPRPGRGGHGPPVFRQGKHRPRQARRGPPPPLRPAPAPSRPPGSSARPSRRS